MSRLHSGFCAIALAALAAASAALAETSITIRTDQAKLLNIAGVAGTVVVGNPSIADVSVRGSQVFIHGKSQGATNVLVLDREGNQLAGIDVNVETVGGGAVAVFGSGRRYSYNCAPSCEPVMQSGDSFDDYFKFLAQQNASKSGLATGAVEASAAASK